MTKVALVPALTLALIAPIDAALLERLPFTVADSVSMTRLSDPNPAYAALEAPNFKFSPDGRHFLVVTRRGNVDTGYNEFVLTLFSVEDVIHFLNHADRDALPQRDVLIAFETSARDGGIVGAKWLADNETIAFIGRGRDGVGQVYVANRITRAIRKLTNHPEDVAAFDLASTRGPLIYSAWAKPDWSDRNARGYAVTSENMKYLVIRDPAEAILDVRHFVLDLDMGSKREVAMPPNVVPRDLWLSPTGRWAVALSQVQGAPAAWWTGYQSLRSLNAMSTASELGADDVSEDVFGMRSVWLVQFMLIDMHAAAAKPFFDAPSGSGIAGLVAKALWPKDESRVLLVNTFLPLTGVDGRELQRRRQAPAIVEVEISTGKASRIVDLPTADGTQRRRLTSAGWAAEDQLVLEQLSLSDGTTTNRYLRRRRDRWEAGSAPPPDAGPKLVVRQGLNAPPEIEATDPGSGKRRLITDLNPQLRDLTLGDVRVFEWITRDQRKWTGGLALPPGFDERVRYPLVIQTYGFNPDEFLIDGPDGKAAAFAARALANKGMVVLQMPEDTAGYLGPAENENQLALIQQAIDALDSRGFIDPRRVGLIGFSRTGMHVHHAITFSTMKYPFAAATICDSISAGYLSYITAYGEEYPGMLWSERLMGAPFWEAGREQWLKRSPAFNLHLVRTPLRIEQLGTYVPAYWDTFAILKLHNRPVELVHIPYASHALIEPLARLTSQQGNVDWFDFWLNGREDPDPAKAEQYARWRKLRQQQVQLTLDQPQSNRYRPRLTPMTAVMPQRCGVPCLSMF